MRYTKESIQEAEVLAARSMIDTVGINRTIQVLNEYGYTVTRTGASVNPSCLELSESGRCGGCDDKPECKLRRENGRD